MLTFVWELVKQVYFAPACLLGMHDYETVSTMTAEDVERIMKQQFILEQGCEDEAVIQAFERTPIHKTIKGRMEKKLQIRICMCCGKVDDQIFKYTVKRGKKAGLQYNRIMDAREYYAVYLQSIQEDIDENDDE